MRRARNTKILSTLGPATANEKSIRALYEAGADVFRLNFSHGSHADHRANVDTIRRIEAEVQRPIAILMDLQAAKLRVGKIKVRNTVSTSTRQKVTTNARPCSIRKFSPYSRKVQSCFLMTESSGHRSTRPLMMVPRLRS